MTHWYPRDDRLYAAIVRLRKAGYDVRPSRLRGFHFIDGVEVPTRGLLLWQYAMAAIGELKLDLKNDYQPIARK